MTENTENTENTDYRNTSFFERVYQIVARIPYGRVISYGQIARMLGCPGAARTVGWALGACPEHLPWQRVVRADGSIAGGGFAELRRAMLEGEGVRFLPGGRVDMEACEWSGSGSEAIPGSDVRPESAIIPGSEIIIEED